MKNTGTLKNAPLSKGSHAQVLLKRLLDDIAVRVAGLTILAEKIEASDEFQEAESKRSGERAAGIGYRSHNVVSSIHAAIVAILEDDGHYGEDDRDAARPRSLVDDFTYLCRQLDLTEEDIAAADRERDLREIAPAEPAAVN